MHRIIFCVLNVSGFFILVFGLGMLGPTDLIFKSIEKCEDFENIIDFWIVQRRYNRTTNVMDLSVNTPYDIGDNIVLELNGSIKKEGGYKPGSFYLKDKACTALNLLLGEMFVGMLNAAGTEECPLPTGEHQAVDFYFDNSKFTVPHLYGEYKMEVFLYKDEVMQCCCTCFYDLVPKEIE